MVELPGLVRGYDCFARVQPDKSDPDTGLARMAEMAVGPAQFVEAQTADAGVAVAADTRSASAAPAVSAIAPETHRRAALAQLVPSENVLARGAAVPGSWEIDRLPVTSSSGLSAGRVVAEDRSASPRMAWARRRTCRSSLPLVGASSGLTSAGSGVCCRRSAVQGAGECSGWMTMRGSGGTHLV